MLSDKINCDEHLRQHLQVVAVVLDADDVVPRNTALGRHNAYSMYCAKRRLCRYAPVSGLQPFHSVHKLSDSTPVRFACYLLPCS